ncbi:DUF2790 domain-containing protein [Pseudomonas brenneri]|uniref:DUF2790 domain-containing protein n=1 Tax=Pseudomonas brenneri TaxID=129817 RepID=UPI0035717961
MRYLIVALLSVFSTLALAQGESASSLAVQAYDYSQNLDIAKVVQISTDPSTECGPVKSHMVYLDSQGVRHGLDYMRLSDACLQG